MIARMWEAKAEPGCEAELVDWACGVAAQQEQLPGAAAVEVYSSDQPRVVIIAKWVSDPVTIPAPPMRLCARPAYVWDFTLVER